MVLQGLSAAAQPDHQFRHYICSATETRPVKKRATFSVRLKHFLPLARNFPARVDRIPCPSSIGNPLQVLEPSLQSGIRIASLRADPQQTPCQIPCGQGIAPLPPTPPPPAPPAPDRSSAPARASAPPLPASSPCAARSPRPGRARSCRRRSSGSAGD
jgi:hypothetical protein